MILKMDVEGAEWDFIQTIPNGFLNRFDQMVFESHNLIQPKSLFDVTLTIELLKNWELFRILWNGTYLLTKKYSFADDENIFLPIELDQPCNFVLPEIQFGYWNKFTD